MLRKIPLFNVFDVELQVHFATVFIFGNGVTHVEGRAGSNQFEGVGLVNGDTRKFARIDVCLYQIQFPRTVAGMRGSLSEAWVKVIYSFVHAAEDAGGNA